MGGWIVGGGHSRALEAVAGAEVACLAHLGTSWAAKSLRVVAAVDPVADSRGCARAMRCIVVDFDILRNPCDEKRVDLGRLG